MQPNSVSEAQGLPGKRRFSVTFTAICAALLAGCQTPGLMATPNLYADGHMNPFESVPAAVRHNEARVIYATDRAQITGKDGQMTYGHARSASLAFGWAQVEFGEDVPWDTLVENSLSRNRSVDLEPVVGEVREIARLSPSNDRIEVVDGQPNLRKEVREEDDRMRVEFRNLLRESLANTERKEVYLFIHGYNVDFDASVRTIAEIWHFLGRTGVPVSYSWPAGHGGVRGYTSDRESGEFTVFHLKQFIRAIANSPDVERLNIISHSRGTDVALTALRELHLEIKGGGGSTRNELKMGSLILAAPDLDFEVVGQRVGAEGLPLIPERMTVYVSPEDRAIGLSSWLFDSVSRIGTLQFLDLSVLQQKKFGAMPGFEYIDARTKKADFFGHSYFYQSPAVSSDLILILREHRAAGPENGRPLAQEEPGFWVLDNDYPKFPGGIPAAK